MRIALIGTGNLATHLVKAFEKSNDIDCVQWVGRKTTPHLELSRTPYFTQFQKSIDTDVCLVAVSDDQITHVAHQLKDIDILVAHTAGAISTNALEPIIRKGVFYPLQSFLQNTIVNWDDIPICIEATNRSDEHLLKTLANSLSKQVHTITQSQRLHLHAAAVFANNFCNHLLGISQNLTEKSGLPFAILEPLIRETFERSFSQSTLSVQTGPAKRNDLKTQDKHLALLSEKEVELYRSLSQTIFNTHNT